MAVSIEQLLDASRRELIDLSTRNRLLSIPVQSKSARLVHVVDERSEQVYRLLVAEKKALSFLPSDKAPQGAGQPEQGLPQPEEEAEASQRYADLRLQTALTPEGLQRRLLTLYRDAQTMIEEQGVNILYLALGHLKWIEAHQPDAPYYAPLILVPVELQRRTASERFFLRWREEDLQENLSLRAKLAADFSVDLPAFPDDEDLDIAAYFGQVGAAVQGLKGWEVCPDAITLGFFSFAKFLMYRDLDPANWPRPGQLLDHPLIKGLVQEGLPPSQPPFAEDVYLDSLIPAERLDHVVDSDSSQTLAIEAVRAGQNLVIQGPPGTGKSQSITNIIATAVLDGKRVLFVAEKLAALEVVKRRLEREGLGALCLELHSNKANKRAVLEEIGRTWSLGRPKDAGLGSLIQDLEHKRSILNGHVAALHEPLMPCGLSPFSMVGQLLSLEDRGKQAAETACPGALTWTAKDWADRRRLAQDLVALVGEIGLPSQHPWRGVQRETVMKVDWDGLEAAIRSMGAGLADLMDSALVVSRTLALAVPKTLQEAARLEQIGRHLLSAPTLDRQAMADPAWDKDPGAIKDLVAAVRTWADTSGALSAQVTPAAWTEDLSESRRWIAEYGPSLLRILNGPYRRSIARLRGLVSGPLPKTCAEQLALIDRIMAGQKALAVIRQGDTLGRTAFGTVWRQDKTDASAVEAVFNWVTRLRQISAGGSLPDGLLHVQDTGGLAQQVEALSGRLAAASQRVGQVFESLQIDCKTAFEAADVQAVSIDALSQRSAEWVQQPEALSRWSRYAQAARQGRQWGLAELVDRLDKGAIPAQSLLDALDRVVLSQWLREAIKQRPSLGQFDGLLHDRQVAEFRQLDRQRLTLAKVRVLDAHVDRMPPVDSGVGAAGIIAGEIQRKRGHRPIRRLLKDAGTVVQAIKPVFMMSPLSVAQFLEPGAVEFDLMVMDEASQVQPVDALGAIVRCKQIVVVGDSRQLPPTRFFTRLTSNTEDVDQAEEEEPQAASAQDIESILGLCCARGLTQAMLRWHYRSRHHSLIAVSNHEFYEDRLFIIPSPFWKSDVLGVKYHAVAKGVYDSGGTRANRIEAEQVCRAIMEHAEQCPDLSLGVATFSVQQQQEILDQLERLRRENPDTEGFFADHEHEPFFVKNLENVQGDERDVIFISVGYGRDSKGVVAMRFGPLSQEGGERRLNVLISRAKQRCEVFASITSDDIDLERASGRGVSALKTFLHYAQTGELDQAQSAGAREPSPFEQVVRRSIQSLGYQVHAQVGLAGLFLDLAVVHPKDPSRYVLGVECDGPEYRASRSARDRDRLSQAVLEAQGWALHRIWSEDWFQRPAEQLQKVRQAIDKALAATPKAAGPSPSVPTTPAKPAPSGEQTIQRQSRPSMDDRSLASLAVPYKEAKVKVPKRQDPGDVSREDMATIVRQVVDQEGPIRQDELVARIRALWGLTRTTPRLQQAVTAALELLVVTRFLVRDEGFVSTAGSTPQIRNREQASPSVRKPEALPPIEIRHAILALVSACHGAAREEIPTAVARLLGLKATTTPLRELIDGQVTRLLQDGSLQEANGLLKTQA